VDYIQIGLQTAPVLEVPLEYEISQGRVALPRVGFSLRFVDAGVIVLKINIFVMQQFVTEIGTRRYVGFDEKYASTWSQHSHSLS